MSEDYIRDLVESEAIEKNTLREEKGRRYISDPSEAPEGADVQQGEQGGYYYETENTAAAGDEMPAPAGEVPGAESGNMGEEEFNQRVEEVTGQMGEAIDAFEDEAVVAGEQVAEEMIGQGEMDPDLINDEIHDRVVDEMWRIAEEDAEVSREELDDSVLDEVNDYLYDRAADVAPFVDEETINTWGQDFEPEPY